MLLLLDVGNTRTHLGLANRTRVLKHADIPTAAWLDGSAEARIAAFAGQARLTAAAFCSVVPAVSARLRRAAKERWRLPCLELTAQSVRGIGLDYPKPGTIGPDRLANAVAAKQAFGAPAVVVDFGTAVTFDVIDRAGNYVGGIIAPGLAAMTEYLHEKTALLPRIRIRDIPGAIGKSTEQAMLVGAVHGYRGLVRELILELKRALNQRRLPVIATGGYAELIARKLPEITAVRPLLTLEGVRLVWQAHQG